MSELVKSRAKANYEKIIRAKQEHVQGNARDQATKAFTERAARKTGNSN